MNQRNIRLLRADYLRVSFQTSISNKLDITKNHNCYESIL